MPEQIKGWVEKGRPSSFSAQSQKRRRPGDFLSCLNRLVLLGLGGFLLARWLRERQEQAGPPLVIEDEGITIDRYVPQGQEVEEPAAQARTTPLDVPAETPQAVEPSQPDDLTTLEGIGPKISSLLQKAGIMTYRQLAETEVSRLQEILRDGNLRLADPGTWPEQARLLDAGQLQEFQNLIDQLKAGRRI